MFFLYEFWKRQMEIQQSRFIIYTLLLQADYCLASNLFGLNKLNFEPDYSGVSLPTKHFDEMLKDKLTYHQWLDKQPFEYFSKKDRC